MKQKDEWKLQGEPICPGVAIGRFFFYSQSDDLIEEKNIPEEKIEDEIVRFYKALKSSRKDILSLRARLQKEGGDEAVAILSTHLEITKDPLITVCVEEQIRTKRKNPEYVFKQVFGEYESEFHRIPDKFFQERLKDFQDVFRRVIHHLKNQKLPSLSDISYRAIIFSEELSPTDAAEANLQYVEGFVTQRGSDTSHVAIMARSRNIPFISNVEFPNFSLVAPYKVIVDGESGQIIFNPSQNTLKKYRILQDKRQLLSQELNAFKKNPFNYQRWDLY